MTACSYPGLITHHGLLVGRAFRQAFHQICEGFALVGIQSLPERHFGESLFSLFKGQLFQSSKSLSHSPSAFGRKILPVLIESSDTLALFGRQRSEERRVGKE